MMGSMRGRSRKATAITSAAVALLAGGAGVLATSASAAGPSLHGCPFGAVCIYPQGKSVNGGRPEAGGVYFSYGAHNLSNQFGNHTIVNNQYGGAGYQLRTGYGGSGSGTETIRTVGNRSHNLTPINSIVLVRPRPCPPNHCPV